jgi:hypothetical protein
LVDDSRNIIDELEKIELTKQERFIAANIFLLAQFSPTHP